MGFPFRLSLLRGIPLVVGSILGFSNGGLSASAPEHGAVAAELPSPLAVYEAAEQAAGIDSLGGVLWHRLTTDPFNGVASALFLLAVLHTFLAGHFRQLAHRWEEEHRARGAAQAGGSANREDVCFKAEIMHFFGEVEAIFGLWVVPLIVAILGFHGWGAVTRYLNESVHYTEPMFVVVIMTIASTRPILKLAETCLRQVARLGRGTPAAWWFSILTIAPLLGSFVTEPAAMTIGALLLAKLFYRLEPSRHFSYATLGLLFVNVSVGGTLTHFAAPPVLMVAGKWGWDLSFMFLHFGDKALLGIVLSNLLYYAIFRREFARLREKAAAIPDYGAAGAEPAAPAWITGIILAFMAWTVFTLHYPVLFLGGFLFFLAFAEATSNHQDDVALRGPLLVGFFLAGLVTHGTLQQWWIAPVLGSLGEWPLFLGATILTAFNDNAAITFLASQVPAFDPRHAADLVRAGLLDYAVVAGAVTGGGLTVIANAPNPAGQSILARFFANGVSPLWLAVWAIVPTILVGTCFMLLR